MQQGGQGRDEPGDGAAPEDPHQNHGRPAGGPLPALPFLHRHFPGLGDAGEGLLQVRPPLLLVRQAVSGLPGVLSPAGRAAGGLLQVPGGADRARGGGQADAGPALPLSGREPTMSTMSDHPPLKNRHKCNWIILTILSRLFVGNIHKCALPQGPPCSLDLLEQDPGHLVVRETGLRKILQEESFTLAVKVSHNNWLA